MEENNLVTFPRPCYGRIPNFVDARLAAKRLRTLKNWQRAKCVFSAPDSSLHPARREVLRKGESLLVAAPRIKLLSIPV